MHKDARLGGITDLRTIQAWDERSCPGIDNLRGVLSSDDHSFREPEEVHDFPTTSRTELQSSNQESLRQEGGSELYITTRA